MTTMFGALNRFISRLDSESPSQSSKDGERAFGFQVLRNKNLEIAIEPWYDFIIGINGRQVVREYFNGSFVARVDRHQDDPDPNLFATEVRNCAGSSVSLALWNAKVCLTRGSAVKLFANEQKGPTVAISSNSCSYTLPHARHNPTMDGNFFH